MSNAERTAPAGDYDQFVDWGKRLEREAPLFWRLFDEAGARTVIDVGAGSARHAVMFARRGMAVDAVDPDESMLQQAERNVAENAEAIAEAGGELRLLRAGFGELRSLGLGESDALVCTGNALPHVEGVEGLRVALRDFAAVLRSGGLLVLHLLNHARLLEKKPRTIPPVLRDTDEGVKVFLRVIDYPSPEEYLDFDFLTLVRSESGEWELTHRRSAHTALPFPLLTAELTGAGFGSIELLGGHDGHELRPDDESLIVVARKL